MLTAWLEETFLFAFSLTLFISSLVERVAKVLSTSLRLSVVSALSHSDGTDCEFI